MKRFSKHNLHGIDEEFIESHSVKITEEELRKVQKNSNEIRRKFETQKPLKRFLEDAKLLVLLIQEYGAGRYRLIPWWALSAVVFSLLYVFNPLDIIPEFLPGIGYLDDAAVVSLCLAFIEEELVKFKTWKSLQSD